MAATLNLTGYDGARLARMTASAAARALNKPGYRADCEAWAQHWWGLPYEVVRHKTPEELEPQLTAWLNSLTLPPAPKLAGSAERVEL